MVKLRKVNFDELSHMPAGNEGDGSAGGDVGFLPGLQGSVDGRRGAQLFCPEPVRGFAKTAGAPDRGASVGNKLPAL